MKEAVRIILGGALSIVIAGTFLKIAVNYDASVVNKIGESGKTRLENSMETTVYPYIKVVNPAENTEVHFGNTLLYAEREYSLHGIIYATTVNGEYLNIEFTGVYNEKTHESVAFNPENGYITFVRPGIYNVKMIVHEEEFEMRIPVAKRWSK
ncbi:MAG: hypothetical protein IKX99_04315 [Lachnospiraceae bacterium]|nr:hypothetical protein [Lachnospiraceae bacterium]